MADLAQPCVGHHTPERLTQVLRSAQDPGRPVQWIYVTKSTVRRLPDSIPDPLAWARENPAVLVLRRGNEIVWRRAQDPGSRPAANVIPLRPVASGRRHLRVVR